MDWKLADAKNRFSEVVNLALYEGPQKINRRDDAVILISEEEYERLTGKIPTFKSLLLNGPSLEGLDLSRGKTTRPDIKL